MYGTAEHAIKHTLLCSFVASQPFAVYVDAYPALENKILIEEIGQLNYGEHNNVVRLLQQKLNQLSYYDDPVDGDFDIITEHALKKFQESFDIDVTGQANPRTVHAIIESEKKKMLSKVEELSESIDPNVHGEDIKIVQESLAYFGYYEGEIDGLYGPLTEKALKIAEDEHDVELISNLSGESLSELYETDEDNEAPSEEKESEGKNLEQDEDEEIDEEKEVKTVNVEKNDHSNVIETAQELKGTPYVWGGESPSGFDCSGFINYVYDQNDITVPRTVNEMWNFSQRVDHPSVGDLVFFETYKPGPSHMGIYLGDGKFIHAGESSGVETSELENPYWNERYIGAGRID